MTQTTKKEKGFPRCNICEEMFFVGDMAHEVPNQRIVREESKTVVYDETIIMCETCYKYFQMTR